jgi:NAD(P) transhydrogenase
MKRYDLVVIGSGPSGQKGAIAGAKMGKKVALVEKSMSSLGGVCLHTGTIPSKTMREAILHLTGFRQKSVYSDSNVRKRRITMEDLRRKLEQVTERELEVIRDQLSRNDIDVISGRAKFIDDHRIEIDGEDGFQQIEGDYFLVGVGSKPVRSKDIPFDGKSVLDSDDIIKMKDIPRSLIVIGGGVIGIEYAIMFALLGIKVTVIDGRERLLEFCDREIVELLMFHARSIGVVFRLGEQVAYVAHRRDGGVVIQLQSQKRMTAEAVLCCMGRCGDLDALAPQNAGLQVGSRGKLVADENCQTNVPHIYAVGDVIGFPALASTSMEQGRKAICHAFNRPYQSSQNLPYGLYTIPEISMIGKTEEELTKNQTPFEIGIARFNEVARGSISGDQTGMLKLLFHRETKNLLGVHCIGDYATEIVHIGQAVMELGGTIEYFCNHVFNYPTMSEAYRVAAFDGLNRLDSMDDLPELNLLRGTQDLARCAPTGCESAAESPCAPSLPPLIPVPVVQ